MSEAEDRRRASQPVTATPPSKGRYTELVESIDKRLANIERIVTELASERRQPQTVRLTADDLHDLVNR